MKQALVALRQIPGYGWLGVALIAFALVFDRLAVAPMEAQITALEARIEAAAAAAAKPLRRVAADRAPEARLRAFYAFFAKENYDTDQLAKLEGIAEQLHLSIASADYAFERIEAAPLTRYRITLPMSGSYAQVRAFAENALLQIPTLSLDAIRFRRVGTGSGTIEAEVRFTLYGVMTDGVKR